MDSTTSLLSTENDKCTLTSTFNPVAIFISIWASIMVVSLIDIVLNLMVLSALVKKKEVFGLQSSIQLSLSKCETEGYCAKAFCYIFFHLLSIYYSCLLAYLVYVCFEQKLYSYSISMFIPVCPIILTLVSTLLGSFIHSCIKLPNLPKMVPVKYKCYVKNKYLGSSSVHQNIYYFALLVQYFLFSVLLVRLLFFLVSAVFGVLFCLFAGYIYDVVFSETTKQCITPHEEENPVPVWTKASMNSHSSVERSIKSTNDSAVTLFSVFIVEFEDLDTETQHLPREMKTGNHSTWNGEPNTKKSCGVSTNYDLDPTKADQTL